MEQLRPLEAPIVNNTLQVEPPIIQTPPVTKTVDMQSIAEPDNKFKFDIFSNDINTDFVKKKPEDAKPDADNRNTQYINPGAQQNGSSNSPLTVMRTKEDLRGGVRAFLMVMDFFISGLALKITKETRRDVYTPTSGQSKLNEDTIIEFIYGKSIQIPPWMAMTFALIGSYGMILIAAMKNKKTGSNKLAFEHTPNIVSEKKPIINTPTKTPPPVLYQEYNVSKDGTATPVKQSSPGKPDETITANTLDELREYVSKGIYPMYRKNGQGKPIRVNYHYDGTPKIQGNMTKVTKKRL